MRPALATKLKYVLTTKQSRVVCLSDTKPTVLKNVCVCGEVIWRESKGERERRQEREGEREKRRSVYL